MYMIYNMCTCRYIMCIYDIYFKKLAHMILGAIKSKIHSVG